MGRRIKPDAMYLVYSVIDEKRKKAEVRYTSDAKTILKKDVVMKFFEGGLFGPQTNPCLAGYRSFLTGSILKAMPPMSPTAIRWYQEMAEDQYVPTVVTNFLGKMKSGDDIAREKNKAVKALADQGYQLVLSAHLI